MSNRVINRYHGRGMSPGRVGFQTRPTPRVDSSVGIDYAVVDKQELSVW